MSNVERLALIRHGESIGNIIEANPNRAVENWDSDDWPLSEHGYEQSGICGLWLQQMNIANEGEEIWSSDMLRAKQTVAALGCKAILRVKLGIHERPTTNVSWRDMKKQILNGDSNARKELVFGDYGGMVEPLMSTVERIRPVIEEADSIQNQESLAIVSHGYVLMAARILLENLTEDQIVGIFCNQDENNQVRNGDIVLYSRNAGERCYSQRRHISPTRGFVHDPMPINSGMS